MNFRRFYILGFSVVCANSMVTMFLSLYLKSIGLSEYNIGGLVGTFHIMIPVMVLALGFISDRFSCRRMILAGSLLSFFYCIAMPQIESVMLMAVLVAVGGIGLTLSFITINILFLKIVPKEGRGKKVSKFVASLTSGYAVGSAISSIMIRHFLLPVQTIFYGALFLHVLCFLLALKLPEVPIERFPLIKYFHDMKRFPVFCLALIAFSLGFHWGSESFGTVRFLDEHIGADGLRMAIFFLGTGIALAAFSRLAGHLIDTREGFVRYLVFGMVVSGLMHALTSLARTWPQFMILRVLHTCGDGFVIFSVPMLVSLAFPSGRMGGNYGFNRTMTNIGSAIGSAFSGFIAARYFLGTPFIITGLFQVVVGGVIWLLGRHLHVTAIQNFPPERNPAPAAGE